MERIHFNTLISDESFKRLKSKGAKFRVERLDDDSFENELFKKVKKNGSSFLVARNREEFLTEYGNLLLLVKEIGEFKKITDEELEEIKRINLEEKGSFSERIFLRWATDTDESINNEKKSDQSKK